MGTGILMCGLNGVGKSTLGKALAEKMRFHFIDNEGLLLCEMKAHENFIFTSVKGDYGETILSFFQYAVLIHVPREIRLQRVRDRSFKKFGNRILPGGDLYEKEEQFFEFVISRAENTVEEWAQSLSCPIIRVDGTRPIEENVNDIVHYFESIS